MYGVNTCWYVIYYGGIVEQVGGTSGRALKEWY